MKPSWRLAFLATSIGCCAISGAALAAWPSSGAPVCMAAGGQETVQVIPDGTGGAIYTWVDRRNGRVDIYAQRLDALGLPTWISNGVVVCSAYGDQIAPKIITDGEGGAIIAWQDHRDVQRSGVLVYAQRVSANGRVAWAQNGVPINAANLNFAMIVDGRGGAILVWCKPLEHSWQVHAQRIGEDGTAQWAVGGVPVGGDPNWQAGPKMVVLPDGAGGAVIVWEEQDGVSLMDLRAQRLDSAGSRLWGSNGLLVTSPPTPWPVPRLSCVVTDASGGALIFWAKWGDGAWNVYGQSVSAGGTFRWADGGARMWTAAELSSNSQGAPDGAGGAFLAWDNILEDGTSDIRVQRVDSRGVPLWAAGGIAVCPAADGQRPATLASDGDGGVIVTWSHVPDRDLGGIGAQRLSAEGTVRWKSGGVSVERYSVTDFRLVADGAGAARVAKVFYGDVYGQTLDLHGRLGYLGPTILSLAVPESDPGGRVRLSIERSCLDESRQIEYPVASYLVWRRVDDAELVARLGDISTDEDAPTGLRAGGKESWLRLLAAWPLLREHDRWFVRFDFAAPGTEQPTGLWELVGGFPARRLAQYSYALPAPGSASEASTGWAVYLVTAHCEAPNSWFTSLPDSVGIVTGEPMPSAATAVADGPLPPILLRNAPNPFNPITTISCTLDSPSACTLQVHDIGGRLVQNLFAGTLAAGRHDFVWDGRDKRGQSVASGIYFYRLISNGYIATGKMTLAR